MPACAAAQSHEKLGTVEIALRTSPRIAHLCLLVAALAIKQMKEIDLPSGIPVTLKYEGCGRSVESITRSMNELGIMAQRAQHIGDLRQAFQHRLLIGGERGAERRVRCFLLRRQRTAVEYRRG